MNIVHVKIENMLGLTEAEIKPGQITLLEGRNGAGKSGVMDAILAAFSTNGIEGELVTKGADKGRVFIKLDDGHSIRAQFDAAGKKTLSVTTPDGDTKKAPQTWLDGLFGSGIINPVSFISLTTAEKRKILMQALPITVTQEQLEEWFGETLPVDTGKHGLEVLADAEKLYYQRRANANQEVKSLQNELDVVSKDIPSDFDPSEWADFDVSEAQGELELAGAVAEQRRQLMSDASKTSHEAERRRSDARDICANNEKLDAEIAQWELRIKQAQDKKEANTKDAQRLIGECEALDTDAEAMIADAEGIEVPDTQAIKDKLARYTQAQRIMQQTQNRDRLKDEVARAKAKAEELGAKVEVARQKPKDMLTQVEFPVDGIEFSDTDIKINGLSIDSLSDGEKLKLGVAIAKATAGESGFICVDGAEVLDADNLQWLMQQADEKHQFFISKVGTGELKITTPEVQHEEAVDERQISMFDKEE